MNKQLADGMQKSLGISQEQIVREEYEMIILKKLFESEIGRSFVFKGGTALRLAYGSPRFSEDLDFSAVFKFDKNVLNALLKSIDNEYKALELIEARRKHFTYFALFKVKEGFMSQAFSIKFEASMRPVNWQKDKDYQLLALSSKVTGLTVLAQIVTLERIKQEKLSIDPARVRDIFDLWFIDQKLGKTTPMNFKDWDMRVVRRELHKFLPEQDRRLLLQWLSKG